ncbi:MAG TPA: NTPase [Candidatus Bathyarchaeia archaeon]|nr:NTPase [Candidatus Bathyarchaeia archaeon]
MKRLLLVTGRPGIGKTTVLLNTAAMLKERGCSVGGMISREVRQKGNRVGFEIIDFETGCRGWLAHVNQPTGPQVGKYRVNLRDLDSIGVKAIQTALRGSSIVIVDEIGPMELFSQAFIQVIKDTVDSSKLVLGVIHNSARHPLIETIKRRDDTHIETVTVENRSSLHNILIQNALQYLQ